MKVSKDIIKSQLNFWRYVKKIEGQEKTGFLINKN